jgi:hypothetical protein
MINAVGGSPARAGDIGTSRRVLPTDKEGADAGLQVVRLDKP